MVYRYSYKTPKEFDNIVLESDGEYLTGLWFEGSHDLSKHNNKFEEKMLPIFKQTIDWLDLYFKGEEPNFTLKYKVNNLTPFRKDVIDIMNTIPFGQTLTYGEIAKMLAEKKGIERMSAQAVGGAVGWNPICIIIPCHRVVGGSGNLTGYGGGIKNKIALLKLEKHDMNKFFTPSKGNKL